MWGKQVYNTGDLSRNNWWLAMVTFGEGWHNNHHAFDYSARQGLEWWQIDLTWYVIKIFKAIGWATDVKTPTESHKQRKMFNSEMVAEDMKTQAPTKSQKFVM
ncbi:palmitoyl-monogalactosyldiacylglycerol delta-7 desaturase [Pyrus ussuriensis x Pyrus communis]|uniref:Palmitoyl-monogalactosyldiacylglycerol delta-7 desaturase n=1 Tax=Pyrus ussuriensis x Pyrus communis TaxID=2448454 RepID=A0A5N5GFC9_9ROSA|nr:palmitoyl-monogalactosyldiacylglycerol delta-7 desaturase [Pyrus ussuriensis x Pyrus communis]